MFLVIFSLSLLALLELSQPYEAIPFPSVLPQYYHFQRPKLFQRETIGRHTAQLASEKRQRYI
jgi:hypothetical protein